MDNKMQEWLPPIKKCCTKCDEVVILIQSNLTLHFKTNCPEHGLKGIESPFAKSSHFKYTIRVADKLRTMNEPKLF